jgi:hypothetical protein
MKTPIFALLALLCSTGACTDPPTASDVLGMWGGEHISLTITPTGATLEYDCAHGAIDEPLIPRRDRSFDLSGTHTLEHGGPIRQDEEPDIHPARYTGRINGRSMTLTITLTDTDQVIGTFQLVQGAFPRLFKCL